MFTVHSSTFSVVNIKQIELYTIAQHRFLLLLANACENIKFKAVDFN